MVNGQQMIKLMMHLTWAWKERHFFVSFSRLKYMLVAFLYVAVQTGKNFSTHPVYHNQMIIMRVEIKPLTIREICILFGKWESYSSIIHWRIIFDYFHSNSKGWREEEAFVINNWYNSEKRTITLCRKDTSFKYVCPTFLNSLSHRWRIQWKIVFWSLNYTDLLPPTVFDNFIRFKIDGKFFPIFYLVKRISNSNSYFY